MSVDIDTVRRVARLARIAVTDDDAARMTGELNAILGFVEQLDEVDVSGVEPMTSVIPMRTSRSGSFTGRGRNKTASTRLNMTLLTPIPRARAKRATTLKPGFLTSCRRAVRRSFM